MMKQIVPHLTSNDVSKSVDYFKNALNFKVAYTQSEDDGKSNFAILKKDSIEIMISSTETIQSMNTGINTEKIGATVIFYIQMDSINDYYNEVKETANIKRELFESDWGTTEFWVEDTDGYLFAFFKQ